jgi:hypothetical protein
MLASSGLAASSSAPISRALRTLLPSTFTGLPAFAGHNTQGALNHPLPQVSNGATEVGDPVVDAPLVERRQLSQGQHLQSPLRTQQEKALAMSSQPKT